MIDQIVRRFNPRAETGNGLNKPTDLQFLARGARVAVTPRSRLLSAKLDNGLVIRGYNRPGYGGRGIYMFREHVEPELSVFADLLGEGDWAIDVGSCVGTYTLTAAHRLGEKGAVVAIDPNPAAMSILTDNALRNGLRNVLPICAAAAEHWGFADFDSEHERPDARGLVRAGQATPARRVMTVSIDEVFASVGEIKALRAMKVDAEGAEDMVLRGARETIARWKPAIVIEQAVRGVELLHGYEAWSTSPSRNQVWIHHDDSEARRLLIERDFAITV